MKRPKVLRVGSRKSPRRPSHRPSVEAVERRLLLATFTVTNNTDGGPGSLRQAITDSNRTESSQNTINFNIAVGSVAEQVLPTVGSLPTEIVQGPDGNLWFTEFGANQIGRLTPSGVLTEFPIPSPQSGPYGITPGPDGNLWFTEFNNGSIGRITPTGTITEFFDSIIGGGAPDIITNGPDGNLWFTDPGLNQIGRITTTGGFSVFPLPTSGSTPYGIVTGPDGNLWFTEQGGNQIGRITPTGTITEFPVPTANSAPFGITLGPNGNLWFTEQSGNKVGEITTTGTITEFTIPTASSFPAEITTGSDGNLWFSEENANQVARLTTSGTFTEFALPGVEPVPIGLTNGPDGNLWIAEEGAGRIGRLTVNAGLTITPATELPAITTPATVDGYSQPGSSPNTLAVGDNARILITLSGINAPSSPVPANGLTLGFNSTVEGLAINNFPGAGIVLNSSDASVVGNFIGTDTTGTIAAPNAGGGVSVTSFGSTIGGSLPASRNVISGNGTAGIAVIEGGFPVTTIQGNYIGTSASGTAALANANGITLDAGPSESTSGGGESVIGNVISGNTFIGLAITVDSVFFQTGTIQGNLIGTDATGTAALGNGTIGMLLLDEVSNRTIGGTTAGQGNTISFNGTDGIRVASSGSASSTSLNNTITGNTINSNGGNGVAILNGSGNAITANTILGNKADGVLVQGVTGNPILSNSIDLSSNLGIQLLNGGNNNQPFPTVTSVTSTGTTTTITGSLHAAPVSTFVVQFFSSPAPNPSGFGEGRTFLGQINVTTDGNGDATFNTTLSVAVAADQYITATATDPNNNTSQFSEDTADLAVTGTATPPGLEEGYNLTYSFTVTNNGPSPAAGATLVDTLPANVNFVSATGGATPVAGKVTIPLGTIDRGVSTTVTVVVQLAGTDTITNTATASSTTADPDTGNNSATVNYVVPHQFTVTNTNNSGLGSLNQAILFTNLDTAFQGQDLILFNIPGAGPHTISPTVPLPAITHGAIINGYTQPGSSANTQTTGDNAVLQVVLNGAGAGANADGLDLNAAGIAVLGLVIDNFQGAGIGVNATNESISGDFLGTDATGSAAQGNGVGIRFALGSGNSLIGGDSPAMRNLISGNTGDGIDLLGSTQGVRQVVVQGNLIGTNAAGTGALGNGGAGVHLFDLVQNNSIGAQLGPRVSVPPSGQGNVISFNGGDGIRIESTVNFDAPPTLNNTISGNTIDSNGGNGVSILEGSGNSVTDNTILNNKVDGVLVQGAIRNPILTNSIDQNGHLGIELKNGGNNNQPAPVLTSSTRTPNSITIRGTLHAAPDSEFLVQFFSSPAFNASGFTEGRTFLGESFVTTNANGDATINSTFEVQVPADQFITATATDPNNNTSQFSENNADLSLAGTATPPGLQEGYNLTYSFTVTNNGPSPAPGVALVDTLPANVNFVSATGGATPVERKVTIPLGTVDPGASRIVTVVVQLASTGPVINTATVFSVFGDTSPGNNTVTITYVVPHQFTVTNTNDSGLGSLRQAILFTNQDTAFPGQDLIDFKIPGTGTHTISPTTALPAITHPVIINAFTQPGAVRGNAIVGNNSVLPVVLSGANAGPEATGLVVAGGSSLIWGLVINAFGGSGITLTGRGGDTVAGDLIGTDPTGTVPVGNRLDGVQIDGTQNNTIGMPGLGNVIAANQVGVYLFNGASNNAVQSNMLGSLSGSRLMGNSSGGVLLGGANRNLIGGTFPVQGNVIAGNPAYSGLVLFLGSTGNIAAWNTIANNGQDGVFLLNAPGNRIGIASGPNTIMGNGFNGVDLQGAAATGNMVQFNRIMQNRLNGVYLFNAPGNQIGGTGGLLGNVITASGFSGVEIEGAGATGNTLQGNTILGSQGYGVLLLNTTRNTVGGAGTASNTIQSNVLGGIQVIIGGFPPSNVTGGNIILANNAQKTAMSAGSGAAVSTMAQRVRTAAARRPAVSVKTASVPKSPGGLLAWLRRKRGGH
jgi:uncharacterized repeat protein (TIGR01451 family)